MLNFVKGYFLKITAISNFKIKLKVFKFKFHVLMLVSFSTRKVEKNISVIKTILI